MPSSTLLGLLHSIVLEHNFKECFVRIKEFFFDLEHLPTSDYKSC